MQETAIADAADQDLAAHDDGSPEWLAIDTLRTLAMDAVQKAQSGHPGTPMALAPIGTTLWTRFLRYDPKTPDWPNRDRFVLSVGHASMLLYGLLHLAGVDEIDAEGRKSGKEAVSLDDIKQFRQLSSKTPGHPEYRHTTGVEVTTGPLGQGCANSVGMAIAERWLAAHFNKPDYPVFDYNVYTFCSDGDLMEGVSSEAASLAGHLKLSNLCWVYDSNQITIEGDTDLAFDEDVVARFAAYGWNTITVDDAEDVEAFAEAISQFHKTEDRPTFIMVKSVIGIGFPTLAGTHKAHSDPPGEEEIRGAKQAYGWPTDAQFRVPEEASRWFKERMAALGGDARKDWDAMFARYGKEYPDLATELEHMRRGKFPQGWQSKLPTFEPDAKGMASRDAGGKVLNAVASDLQWLIGGAADLAPSTKTDIKNAASFESGSYGARNFHFGIREHAMGSVANGMAACYLRPYTGTFLVFSDYMRPPIRLAAIMELPVTFVFTHDSIGVGEDGPTHQPIEQLAGLRAIPGLDVMRPGDANETAYAWKAAIEASDHPTCLIFSRQKLPTLDREKFAGADGLDKGAYILGDSDDPEVILMATGSELALIAEAYDRLRADGVRVRAVSMPSWYRFELQDSAYKESVLPAAVKSRVAVEMGSELGWHRYVGLDGRTITMSTFGASAPIDKLQDKFGFNVDAVVKAARELMEKH